MIKLGVNSVLFKAYSFEEACRAIQAAGYDGVEISAIQGMCEHLNLDDWQQQAQQIKDTAQQYGLELLSTEVASQDPDRLRKAFEACRAIGIPVVNIGPGGVKDDEESLTQVLAHIDSLAKMAEEYGVTLCVKAHVGNAIYNTPSTLRLIETVKSPALGVDMDPSHIYRSGELPEEALPQVIGSTKHIHIRDCVGKGPSPGEPMQQICGVGEIDLMGYFKAMVDGNYSGPVCLEVIGPDQSYDMACIIAAQSYGYMNALLRQLGAR